MPEYAPLLSAILDREPEPQGGVETREVDYDVAGTACRGFVARPADVSGDLPAVLVVHDWVGVGDYVRMRCEMLARLGYLAFAADIYGADVRPTQQEAAGVAGGYYGDLPLLRERVVGGFERMLAEPGVDRARTAAIGYCFGGSSALQLARAGTDVKGVISFHGGLQTGPAGEAEQIRAAVLVLHGAADPVTPPEQLDAFLAELREVKDLDWQVVVYSGALHAFTQPEADAPDHGAQFQAAAERRSWRAMKDFLAEIFA